MCYDELLTLILQSRYDDWLWDDEKGIFTLKSDLDVTLREVRPDPDDIRQREPFDEEWAREFPDRIAYARVYELWFRASFVKSYYFVSVDGGRARLPYPRAANGLTITREQLAIANAVNCSGPRQAYFIPYIERFTIEG